MVVQLYSQYMEPDSFGESLYTDFSKEKDMVLEFMSLTYLVLCLLLEDMLLNFRSLFGEEFS